MVEIHKGMGITDAEFDAFMGHLTAALKKNGVGPAEAASFAKKIEGTRPDIVEKQKGEEKKDGSEFKTLSHGPTPNLKFPSSVGSRCL